MPRLLLLLPATTYRGEAFLEAAHRLKLEVTVGSDRPGPDLARPAQDLLQLDFRDPEQAAQTVRGYATQAPIHAVIGVDDTTALAAAVIAAALGLPRNPVASVAAARNKFLMRELLSLHGVPVPGYARFSVDSIDEDPESLLSRVRFPCVVKPLVLSASCGVIRANGAEEFMRAFRRVAALLARLGPATAPRRETKPATKSATKSGGGGETPQEEDPGRQILVEDYVPGREVALEGLLTDGALRLLALFDKPDPLEGPFFEETIYVTPSRLPPGVQKDLETCAARATLALGLREGPVHGELRVNEQGIRVIEMAARSIGGRCSQTLRFAAGMSLEELILRQALRLPLPELAEAPRPAGVMMLPIPRAGVLREVRGQAAAGAVPGIESVEITAQVGEELIPLPEGTRYLGFLVARGATPEAVERALREAHRRLEFVIADRLAGEPTPSSAPKPTVVRF